MRQGILSGSPSSPISSIIYGVCLSIDQEIEKFMKKYSLRGPVLALVFFAIGCGAYTHISSNKNPSFNGRIFKKISVEARDNRGQEVLGLEWTFKRKMDNPNLEVIPYSDLFQPNQPYTSLQMTEILQGRGVEGILSVRMEHEFRQTVYHPPTGATTEVKPTKKGGTQVTTYTYGDYTENKLTQNHTLSFLEVPGWKPIWTSNAVTNGDPNNADVQDYFNALANATIKILNKDGLVVVPEKK